MRKRMFVLAAAAGLCVLSAGARADEEALVKYRQAVMASIGAHAGALAAISKGAVPYTAHAAAHADSLKAMSMLVMDAFKDKAMTDKSRAKDNIWSDAAGFNADAEKLQVAAAAVAASAGGQGDMGAAMKELFEACKACHKEYRGPEKK